MKRLRELREESKGQTRFLYHLNYWDGPISGIMLFNGVKKYFCQIGEDEHVEEEVSEEEWNEYCLDCKNRNVEIDEDYKYDYETIRTFGIYELSEEEIEIIEENHKLFQECVGLHTDYDENGNRQIGNLRPREKHSIFYNKDRKCFKFGQNTHKLIYTFKY